MVHKLIKLINSNDIIKIIFALGVIPTAIIYDPLWLLLFIIILE